jgi:hypothetical protein
MSFPTSTSSSDVWSLKSQYIAIAGDNWPALASPDPDSNFNQVSLLLNGDGPDGGQNNTYTDSSTNSFTITKNGDVTQGSVSPFGDNWGVYLDGPANNTYLRTSGGATFSGDLTAECWVNCDYVDPTAAVIFDFRGGSANSNPSVFASSSGELGMYINSTVYNSGVNILNDGQWHHVALVRSSGVYTLYVDGVSTTTASIATSFTASRFQIGADDDGSSNAYYGGYISNLRIVSGTALYTSTFTPPTEPLTAISGTELLTCQSNRFADNSTNGFTLTSVGTPEVTSFSPFTNSAPITLADNGGSAYFDGSSYLTFPTVGVSEFLVNGNFTIESWIYPVSGRTFIFATCGNNSSNGGFNFTTNSSYYLQLFGYVSNAVIAAGTTPVPFNQWSHVAATRSGSTVRLFLNGNLEATATNTQTFNPTTNGSIGAPSTNRSFYSNGYSSNVRFLKDTALYTSAFTPPTAPLTAVTNTELLLNFEDAAIFDYAALNNIGTIGSADISTSVFKYGTGSLAFDGTGDYLSTPSTPVFGTGDFTIEFWVYFNEVNNSTVKFLYDFRNASATSASFFAQEASNGWTYWNGSGAGISTGWNSGTFTADTWYHVAISRSSGTTKFFVDGTVTSSVADTGNYANETFILASRYTAANFLNGYIDDLRITKGLARYTANFTPPEAALPTF